MDENGDGTMDQMEFISLMESKHPLLKKISWAAKLQAGFGEADDDDEAVGPWVDPNAKYFLMISPHSTFRVCWDVMTAVLLVYAAVW